MAKTCNHDNCTNHVFSKGLCMPHWRCSEHNKPIKRSQPKAGEIYKSPDVEYENGRPFYPTYRIISVKATPAKKPIAKVSDKQAKLNKAYSVLNEQFKKDNPYCHAHMPGCTGLTTDTHHMKGRGVYLLRQETWLPTCRSCHQWIHDNHEDALLLGLSFSRLSK